MLSWLSAGAFAQSPGAVGFDWDGVPANLRGGVEAEFELTSPVLSLDAVSMPGVFRLNELVFAGPVAPESPEQFAALREAGVSTIISVDLAPPPSYLAAGFGMEYIHAPVRYGRAPSGELIGLFRVLSWMKGAYYIHAAPGEERALATGAMAAAWTSRHGPERALYYLLSVDFPVSLRGYWSDAAELALHYTPMSVVKALPPDFRRYVPPPVGRVWMDRVNASFSVIRQSFDADWAAPLDYPGTDAAFESLTLAQTLKRWREIEGAVKPEGFAEGLRRSESAALDLRQALLAGNGVAADQAWLRLGASCLDCHQRFRDQVDSDLVDLGTFDQVYTGGGR